MSSIRVAALPSSRPVYSCVPHALQTVTVWAQCGGMFGGNRCSAKPDGSARCGDSAWSWVTCPSFSTCTRLNYGFWQCRPH